MSLIYAYICLCDICLQVGGSVSSALTCMVNAVLSMVVVCVVSPVAMLALGPLLMFYWRVQVRLRVNTCVRVCRSVVGQRSAVIYGGGVCCLPCG